MKIKENKISSREHIVKVTNRVMKATLELQLTMAENDAEEEDVKPIEFLRTQQRLVNKVLDYITNTLKLNQKEKDKLDDLEFSESVDIANHIILRVQGLSEEDIKKAEAEQADDKSEAEAE
ncbi:phage tail tube assembly chaperone [Lacticaseibacillus jixiensis]|uniref:phage tail tube assembly chaperone n=1 Tax=Lacticaseibacillus jixiensis TaxID=3231926 RepID=UPI0036F1A5DC